MTIFTGGNSIYMLSRDVKPFTRVSPDLPGQAERSEDTMEYDEVMAARLSVIEQRLGEIEQKLFMVESGIAASPRRKKRDLTPEQRAAIRARLVAGQERKRVEREAEAKAQAPIEGSRFVSDGSDITITKPKAARRKKED